ncbi:MAG TPA: MDR family MFS transporter [bacterium]|nr:MDR family MFS transporter [bacterium]
MGSRAPAAAPGRERPNYKWEVLWVVMLGTLMAALDQSIVNIALPDMMSDFGCTTEDIEWVVTGYMLSFSTLMPLTSWLRDRVGYRNIYLASLVVFTLGSVLCGLAWNLPSLVFFRVVQAIGGGAITPTSLAMISEVFPPEERGQALGYWGVGVIMGPAFGPTLGGFLTHTVGWRSIFWVNLPIGILGTLLALSLLRRDAPHPDQRKPFDFFGFGFLSLFLVSFLLAVSQGEEKGWSSAYITVCFILSALGLVGFLVVDSLVEHGIIDFKLFRYPMFAAGSLVIGARSVALFGGMFLAPIFMQNVMGFDEVQSGLIMLPGALLIAVFMPISGRISDKIGPFYPTLAGLIGVVAFMALYRGLDADTTVWGLVYPTLIRGVGIGLLIAPVMAASLNVIPRASAGMASAVMNLLQQVAGSIGIAVLGTFLDHRTHFHQMALAGRITELTPAQSQVVRDLADQARLLGLNHAQAHQVGLSALAQQVATAGAVQGFDDAFLFGAAIVALGILPAFLLPKHKVGAAKAPAALE